MDGLINTLIRYGGLEMELIAQKVNIGALNRFIHKLIYNKYNSATFVLFEYVDGYQQIPGYTVPSKVNESFRGVKVDNIVRDPHFLKVLAGNQNYGYKVRLSSSYIGETSCRTLFMHFKRINTEADNSEFRSIATEQVQDDGDRRYIPKNQDDEYYKVYEDTEDYSDMPPLIPC
jgi:hypothetical protein